MVRMVINLTLDSRN